MLPQFDAAEDAEVVSDKIRAHLGTPYVLGGEPLLATASIGAALCREDGQTSSELIDRPDAAMYFDKVQRRSPAVLTASFESMDLLLRLSAGEAVAPACGWRGGPEIPARSTSVRLRQFARTTPRKLRHSAAAVIQFIMD